MDLTGTLLYLGSPSAVKQIAADHQADRSDFTITLRKEILGESTTAIDSEVRAKERKYIVATGANNPAIGYNRNPRFKGGPTA